jgi:ArsR family transcriptional regulator, arsenate/arsenite/antimonite-responsive transcriptional repressor
MFSFPAGCAKPQEADISFALHRWLHKVHHSKVSQRIRTAGNAPAVRSLVAQKMQKPKLTELSEDQVQNIAKALADPRRYEIIKRISRSAQPLACESVRGCLEITAPTLSHHMKELEVAGLITVRRSGKFINYEFRRDVLESFLASLRHEFL